MSNVMLHKPSLSNRLLRLLLGTRLQSWRWLYVFAAVYLATSCIYFILSVYRDAYWQSAAVVFICLLQFFRPTVAGWVSVVVVYASFLGGGLYYIFLELKDYLNIWHGRSHCLRGLGYYLVSDWTHRRLRIYIGVGCLSLSKGSVTCNITRRSSGTPQKRGAP